MSIAIISTPTYLYLVGQAHKVSRSLGGQLLARTFNLEFAMWAFELTRTQPKSNLIKIELHHGSRKSVATLRTVRTLIVRRIYSEKMGDEDAGLD